MKSNQLKQTPATQKVLVGHNLWLQLPANLPADAIEQRIQNFKQKITQHIYTFNPKQHRYA